MKLCDKCFSIVEPEAEFCKECGVPIGDDPAAEGSDALVYPEIARANLLRIRGDEKEAEAVCLAVLRRFPNNSSAHILLGDIHDGHGDFSKALQWYEMALDLSPENQPLREKIKRIKAFQAKESRAAATANLEVKPAGRAMAIAGVALIVLLAASIGLAFWLGMVRANSAKSRLDRIDPVSINGVAPKPPLTTPKQETTQVAPPLGGANGMTSEEQALLTSAAADLGALAQRVPLAVFDEGKAGLRVTAVGGADPAADTTEAANIATVFAKHAGSGVQTLTVRVLDPNSRQVRFSGTATPQSIAAATGQSGSADWAKSIFSTGGQ